MPTVRINKKEYSVPMGSCLREWMVTAALALPCGGKGICGKCRVKIRGEVNPVTEAEKSFLSSEELSAGMRLACFTVVEGDCTVTVEEPDRMQICTESNTMNLDANAVFARYGAVVDIGTTTMVAALYNSDGKRLADAAMTNPQLPWGADVLSRAEAAIKGERQALMSAVQTGVTALLYEVAQKSGVSMDAIESVVVTGNTAMLCLFTGTSVHSLVKAPFTSPRLFGDTLTASACGLKGMSKETPVYLPRCVGAFLGADLVCAIQHTGLCERSDTALLVDIGTNGEMALWHKGRLYLCSTAAGPAFEGVGISCGMPAYPGAIDRVVLLNGQLLAHTIGGEKAKGVCGSGLIDAVACLLDLEEIDRSGCVMQAEFPLAENVGLTVEDVHALQVAKSAICSGIQTLLHAAGATMEEVAVCYLSGGFGNSLHLIQAGRIGLLPIPLIHRAQLVGNAALGGSEKMLLDPQCRENLFAILRSAQSIDLATSSFFADAFIQNMLFS